MALLQGSLDLEKEEKYWLGQIKAALGKSLLPKTSDHVLVNGR